MDLSLDAFLREHDAQMTHIRKTVRLDQVGALTAQAPSPVVFHDLAGFADWRLTDLLFVDRAAQARVLGCDAGNVVPSLADVLRRGPKPLRQADDGPCQERVYLGDDADLGMLPVIRHTDRDPYPYTTSFAVHRDPDSGQYNQMFPRCGVLGPREMVSSFVTSTANRFLARHRETGTPMPQAIAIGAHPAWELAGCYSAPHEGWWEMELFESITGQAGEVVRAVTVPLVVPADASVVIEGWVSPDATAVDGPSPGPNMLFTPHSSRQPVFEVTAITMRERPVYRNHLMTPFTDHQELPRLFHEAIIYDRLRPFGIRDVRFPASGGHFLCLLQLEPSVDGQVTDALLTALGAPWLNMKMVVAVDPDIDIYDDRDVIYAIASRVDPSRDVIIVDRGRASPFDPTASPVLEAGPSTAQTRFPSVVGKWGIDATKPPPYRGAERAAFDRAWPLLWGKIDIADFL